MVRPSSGPMQTRCLPMPEERQLRHGLAGAFVGRRVLVTGHTGFKGGWLSLWLKKLGADVVGVALPPLEGPSLFSAVELGNRIDHRIADIRYADQFADACRDLRPDLVIHMAAQSLVRPSYDDPVSTFMTNVGGTAVVLDAVRRMDSVKGVVVVTSDKCYENEEWIWPYRETDRLGGADPYSASKGCTELVASAFRRSYFSDPSSCAIATVRAGNVIGGGDWAIDRLIPDLVRATVAGAAVTIRNPASVRPWQHVLEPLSGYLEIGARLLGEDAAKYADAWNFGPSPDAFIEVEPLARIFQNAWGKGAARIVFGKRESDLHEANMLTLDSSKAAAQLGWRPVLTTRDAIEMTTRWYRAHAAGDTDMHAFTLEQIEHYESKMQNHMNSKGELAACA